MSFTEAQRRIKICLANSGRQPWNKGKHHSEETRSKIRLRTREAMQRPEVKQKVAAAIRQRGPTSMSDELKARLSLKAKENAEEIRGQMLAQAEELHEALKYARVVLEEDPPAFLTELKTRIDRRRAKEARQAAQLENRRVLALAQAQLQDLRDAEGRVLQVEGALAKLRKARESEANMDAARRERYAKAEHEARELVERCRRRVVELAHLLQACEVPKSK